MTRFALWMALVSLAAACGGDDNGGFGKVDPPPNVAMFNPYRVWSFSPTDTWIVDGSATLHRYDGSTWSSIESSTQQGLSCIFALSPTDVWLCGGTAAIHYDGTTFTPLEVTDSTGLDGLSSIWASSPTDVWAVGDDAIVARYNGSTWSRTIVGSPFKSSIWGASPTDVYALSTFELQHYDGSAWTEVTLDGGGGDGQVWGTSASDIWVVTGSERPSHFDGTSWTTIELDGLVGDLAAVWGAAPDDVWASGSAGAIAHWDGDSWSQVAHQTIGAPYLQQLLSVHGSSADNVWIVGRQLGDGGSTGLIYQR